MQSLALLSLLTAVAVAAPGGGPSYGGGASTYYCTTGQLSCCASSILDLGTIIYSQCAATTNTPAACQEGDYLCCTADLIGECLLPHRPLLCPKDSTDPRCVTAAGGN